MSKESPLLNNAVSSIQVGTQDFEADSEERNLSAVRNIYAGMLLLFKEKLRQMSPADSNELFVKSKTGLKVVGDGNVVPIGKGEKTVNTFQILDHFKTLSISIDEDRFQHLCRLRNDIEHYYTEKPRAVIQNALNDAFLLIRDFISDQLNQEPVDLLGADCWKVLLLNSKVFETERIRCEEQWNKAKLPSEETLKVMINGACPACHSILTVPADLGCVDMNIFTVRCVSCGHEYRLKDHIDEDIEDFFEYAIMKAGAKGGVFPLSLCKSCGNGTFNNYKSICVFCRNTEPGEYDPDFEVEVMQRNARSLM